ncbi:hypothetical protein [Dysgonomonas macrotermitis]|uniref:Uncharacterized protein n=1 Tax=Dysgonomonas macrotermitis TaxID=1346286 RepID=A0A1M5AKF5_9BACT|nr:hypothetical protein [Dysgonomonas macrotermitis]SHF30703.1 hypothetical protein SAMN05444362_10583 [Dysgonomonas macrotermitis]
MRHEDNSSHIEDFDYEKDFNNAYNNSETESLSPENPTEIPSLDPVIERRSLVPVTEPATIATTENTIVDNATAMQMITGNGSSFNTELGKSNFPLALLGGFIASIVCVFIWAAITVSLKYQITYMAIGVGFAVGYAIQKIGKGSSPIYGILGAIFAVLTCFWGNVISYTCFIANEYENYSYFDAITGLDFDTAMYIAIESFDFIDVFFYILAIYTGYMFSIKRNG